MGGVPEAARRGRHGRHPLRHQVVETRYQLARRLLGYAVRRHGHRGRVHDGARVRRIHHERAARGPARRQGVDRVPLRRCGTGTGARRPGPPPGAASLLLEVGEVGQRHRDDELRRARVLGIGRLPQLRRPMAGTAVSRRLIWRVATLVGARMETPTARTLVLQVPDWPGHQPGQHVDVRLTAPDGYSTQRSYSIASAWPGDGTIELTIQRLPDGEVSTYLTDIYRIGDPIELRGPVGGGFGWRTAQTSPVLLLGGGSGVVPLMAMIRARGAVRGRQPFRLIYSVRTPQDALFADELARRVRDDPGLDVRYVYTRKTPEAWPDPPR